MGTSLLWDGGRRSPSASILLFIRISRGGWKITGLDILSFVAVFWLNERLAAPLGASHVLPDAALLHTFEEKQFSRCFMLSSC